MILTNIKKIEIFNYLKCPFYQKRIISDQSSLCQVPCSAPEL